MNHVLVGTVGSIREQAQDLLSYHLPVVRDDEGRLFTPVREDWSQADLRPIDERDHKFVTFFEDEQLQFVRSGTIVFVVGATFYNRCSRIDELKEFSDVFHGWDVLVGPFSWRGGTREEFGRLNRRMLAALERPFYESLFARDGGRFIGEAERIFWVLERLSDVPDETTLLLRGLYYHERRDVTKYELVRQLATVHHYATAGEFDSAIEERINWLSKSRLREEVGSVRKHDERYMLVHPSPGHSSPAYTEGYLEALSVKQGGYKLMFDLMLEPHLPSLLRKVPVSARDPWVDPKE